MSLEGQWDQRTVGVCGQGGGGGGGANAAHSEDVHEALGAVDQRWQSCRCGAEKDRLQSTTATTGTGNTRTATGVESRALLHNKSPKQIVRQIEAKSANIMTAWIIIKKLLVLIKCLN